MTLQPHQGGNTTIRIDHKQRNPKGLRAYPARHPTLYGIGAAWAVRNRAENGMIAP